MKCLQCGKKTSYHKKLCSNCLKKRKKNLKNDWACPHYEAASDENLVEDCREANFKQILDRYLPQWKPVMKNATGKNICADCYHDSVEYFLLTQKLTAEYIAKILPNNYSLSPSSQNAYERMKSGTLTNLEEWEQVKKQIVKEISDYKRSDSGNNNEPDQGNNTDKPISNSKDNGKNNSDKPTPKPNIPNQPAPNHNNQAKEQLQNDIQNLTNKPHRTPEEEQTLQDKKRKLAELTNPKPNQGNQGKNKWGTYMVIALVSCVIIGLGYLLVKKKGRTKPWKK